MAHHPLRNRLPLIGLVALLGCQQHPRRGSTAPSSDGGTFLLIADDNGGECGPVLVDGKAWPYAIGAPGPIAPGDHTLACGGEVEVSIPRRVVFRFDDWGP